MDDNTLLRYSRQIMLPQVDIDGQQRLIDASVMIIGLGGLGSPVAMYLAAAGVGHLLLSDFDRVELSNLQRQIIHNSETIGLPKVESAKLATTRLNDQITVETHDALLSPEQLRELMTQVDLVLDCTDNFDARYAINRASIATATPLLSAAAIRFEGQLALFNGGNSESPCYACLYKEVDAPEERCSQTGVLAPMVGIIGTLQAMEAMKFLLGIGQGLDGQLLLYDALQLEWRKLRLKKDPLCSVCGTEAH